MTQAEHVVSLRLPVIAPEAGWELYEGTMPESELHAHAVDLLRALLRHWGTRVGARIVWSLAIRWVERDARIGVDPDVAVLLPPPPAAEMSLVSLRTWLPGHIPPALAIEVVSESNPHKDYAVAPAKYAASGTNELWIFDPIRFASKVFDGPYLLQIYRRNGTSFDRIYAGDGPAYSPALQAWAVPTADRKLLRIANDSAGNDLWLTNEEAERAAKEAERAAKEAERANAGAAQARIAELEAEIARLKAR